MRKKGAPRWRTVTMDGIDTIDRTARTWSRRDEYVLNDFSARRRVRLHLDPDESEAMVEAIVTSLCQRRRVLQGAINRIKDDVARLDGGGS